jgi:HSP20 family protein
MQSSYSAAGSLFPEMRWLQQQLEEMLQPAGAQGIRASVRGAFPAINVGVTPDSIEVIALVPGVEAREVDVHVERGLLTIAGTREETGRGGDRDRAAYAKERFAGTFRRVIALPDDADPDRVQARCRDGILHVSVAKRESSKPRRIAVG